MSSAAVPIVALVVERDDIVEQQRSSAVVVTKVGRNDERVPALSCRAVKVIVKMCLKH
jgi:hypothetical protein